MAAAFPHPPQYWRRLLAGHQAERDGRVSNSGLLWQEYRHVVLRHCKARHMAHPASASGKHARHYSCSSFSGDLEFLFLGTTTGDVGGSIEGSSISGEKQVRIVLAIGAREHPNRGSPSSGGQGYDQSYPWQSRPLPFCRETSLHRVGHRIPPGSKHSKQIRASRHCDWPPFQDVIATCHPLVLLEMLWKQHPTHGVPSDSSGRNTVVCSSAEKRMCIELSLEACEGPNTLDHARRLMAETGHVFEDMMVTFHLPGCGHIFARQ